MLLVILTAIPLIGALALCFIRDESINIPLITSLIVLILGVFGLKDVFGGLPLSYRIPFSGPFELIFQADALSAVFVLLAAFVWTVVSIYIPGYMKYEGKTWGFNFCTLLVLFSVIGIFLAGDLFTMLLFFELMTIVSYFWVIHRWNKEAVKAGYFYLFFSIVGGLLIALGIVFMGAATGVLPALGSGAVIPLNPKIFAWSIAILIAGFGIKAGMAPLHLWLPHAHSVAPTPGSALLSGLLIKVGAYGLIRVGEFAGWGMSLGNGVTWLGPGLTIIGISTMLVGVISALLQGDAKRLLAYHSVSQMGYIILGLGIGLYLGPQGGFGLSGAIYHIINHALFKIALFLGVGIIYIHTKETNLYNLGGLWRRFPVTAILMLLAVLGITGAPGLNGYASKSLLHHGVSLAADGGKPWLIWVERLFMLVGVGTAASFSKLYYLMFLGKPSHKEVENKGAFSLKFAMILLTAAMLIIGINPKLLLKTSIIPAAQMIGMGNAPGILNGLSFWNIGDIVEMIITLALGALVCWVGLKSGVFHWQPPTWLTIEGLVRLLVEKASVLWGIALEVYHELAKATGNIGKAMRSRLSSSSRSFARSRSGTIWGVNLAGISADAAILIGSLIVLIAWYTLIIA